MESINPEEWRRRFIRDAELRWASHWLTPVLMLVANGAFCLTLAALGFPAWRIGVVASIGAGMSGFILAVVLKRQFAVGTLGWFYPLGLFALGVVMILSGGLHSPLVTLMLGFPALVVARGWSRMTKINLTILGAAMMAAGLLGAQLGPPVPDPFHAIFTVTFFSLGAAIQAQHVIAISHALDASTQELIWERDRKSHQVMARAQELEFISSRLSHELKNPLTAIKALVQVTARTSGEPEVRERLQIVEGEVDRMSAILQDHLQRLKPLGKPRLAPCRLHAVADEVLSVLEARAQVAGVRLVRQGKAELLADERRLKEALVNLVTNAIEASSKGQRVEVSLAQGETEASVVVRDEGSGIAADALAQLGTPFFTTREQGNGLGVLVARWVFTQHGGSLEYASEPGRGTTATGTLPLRPQEVSDVARADGG